VPVRGRYYFNKDAAHYPNWHCFTSRNWQDANGERDAPFGEQPGPQEWFNGSFPVRKPDPIFLGTENCIASGTGGPGPLTVFGPSYLYYPFNWFDPSTFPFVSPEFFDEGVARAWLAAHYPPFNPADWTQQPPVVYFGNGAIVWALQGNPPVTCQGDLFGVPTQCWHIPPAHLCGGVGEKSGAKARWGPVWTGIAPEGQATAAAWAQGFAWTGSAGAEESPAAAWAQGFAWTGSAGAEESPAAAWAQGFAWTGSAGAEESPAAAWAQGFAWTGSAGVKESAAATIVAAVSWTGVVSEEQSPAASIAANVSWTGTVGTKENVAGTVTATATLYFQSTNVDTACEGVLPAYRDLALTVGSGTLLLPPLTTSFVDRVAYDMLFTGLSGAYSVSVDCTAIISATFHFHLEILNAACAVVFTGTTSADFTTTGAHTVSGTLTWPAGGVRVRVVITAKKNSALPGSCTIAQSSSAYAKVQGP
jgi:hypothetical protein